MESALRCLSMSGLPSSREGLSSVGAERSPFGPDGVEPLSELLPETSDGVVKFDPVVGIRHRVGVLSRGLAAVLGLRMFASAGRQYTTRPSVSG